MADAQDSKSCEGDFVWVQVPLSAGIKKAVMILVITAFLYIKLLVFVYSTISNHFSKSAIRISNPE